MRRGTPPESSKMTASASSSNIRSVRPAVSFVELSHPFNRAEQVRFADEQQRKINLRALLIVQHQLQRAKDLRILDEVCIVDDNDRMPPGGRPVAQALFELPECEVEIIVTPADRRFVGSQFDGEIREQFGGIELREYQMNHRPCSFGQFLFEQMCQISFTDAHTADEQAGTESAFDHIPHLQQRGSMRFTAKEKVGVAGVLERTAIQSPIRRKDRHAIIVGY